jgi:hypothetical protein
LSAGTHLEVKFMSDNPNSGSFGTGMSTAVAVPDQLSPVQKEVLALRNEILSLTGPGHGPRLNQIFARLRELHGGTAPPAERPREDAEALVRRFVKR